MSSNNSGGSSFPLFAILGVVFITLKLTGTIAWSWLWVLAPFWGPFALAIVLAPLFLWLAKRRLKKMLAEDPFEALSRQFKFN